MKGAHVKATKSMSLGCNLLHMIAYPHQQLVTDTLLKYNMELEKYSPEKKIAFDLKNYHVQVLYAN